MSKFENNRNNKQQLEIVLPDLNNEPITKLTKNKKVKFADDKEVLYLAGRGEIPSDIMFVTACPLEEEADGKFSNPSYLKGPAGNIFIRACEKCGIDIRKSYYTALVKHCVPREWKLKPKSQYIHHAAECFEDEIARVKPKIIVCLGKIPFDYLYPVKLKQNEIQGGWFRDEKHNCLLYVMDSITTSLYKPEYIERLYIDLREVKRMYDDINGISREEIELNHYIINTQDALQQWVDERLAEECRVLSVDCEWSGGNYIDGILRYTQFCWKPGNAICLQFRNEKGEWMFDCTIDEIKKILHPLCNHPDMRYIGHQISADAVWLKHCLDIDLYEKVIFDTLYAQQVIDEYADLKLERLAVAYTTIGRYDIDLLIWKKKHANELNEDEGYGPVPDKILAPYSMLDVDVPMRCWPILVNKLVQQGLADYYFNIRLPFVTDGFTVMTMTGIPVNLEDLDAMRESYLFVSNTLEKIFAENIKGEAELLLLNALIKKDPEAGSKEYLEIMELDAEGKTQEIIAKVKTFFKRDYTEQIALLVDHFISREVFNYNSSDDMRRWLYGAKGYTPIMTTKKEGMPSIAWEKIIDKPPHVQKNYSPSTDKNVLKIFAERGDVLVSELLELKAVKQIVKSFLRPDDDKGNREGLHKYVCSDNRIHTSFSTTETGRPRSWKPNILNIPKYVNKNIENAFRKCKEYCDKNEIESPVDLSKPYSLRYNFKAPDGWCIVESDYKTAEVVALAYISGDDNMIKVVTEPDPQFGLILDEKGEKKPVRIKYDFSITSITSDKADPDLLVSEDDPRLLKDEEGNLLHPKRDVHWEMAEASTFVNEPREKLNKDRDRGGGKIGVFQIPYGATGSLIERTIEVVTGIKPEPGTGDKIKETYETKFPIAASFLQDQETRVEHPGYYRSVSGLVRHFHIHDMGDVAGLSPYTLKSIMAPLKREARNFAMQEIVAASLSKAIVKLNKKAKDLGLQGRAFIPLYDAIYTICPLEERFIFERLHQECLCDEVVWKIGKRLLKFEIDTEFTIRWATEPTSEEKAILYNRDYCNNLNKIKLERDS